MWNAIHTTDGRKLDIRWWRRWDCDPQYGGFKTTLSTPLDGDRTRDGTYASNSRSMAARRLKKSRMTV
jgi:hypothetical protein